MTTSFWLTLLSASGYSAHCLENFTLRRVHSCLYNFTSRNQQL